MAEAKTDTESRATEPQDQAASVGGARAGVGTGEGASPEAAHAGDAFAKAPKSKDPDDYRGRLIRKLCLVFLAFIAVGVALNCVLGYINTRSTYLSTQSDRLSQVGAYAIDSITSSIDLETSYELWQDNEVYVRAQTDRSKVYQEYNEVSDELAEIVDDIDQKDASGQGLSDEEKSYYNSLLNKTDRLEAAYTYLSIQDMLSRLSGIYRVGHISIFVPNAEDKTVTYITQSQEDGDECEKRRLLDTASLADGYDALWSTVSGGEAMTSVALSPDGSEYLMYCTFESGDQTWVVEVAMSSSDFESSLLSQMVNTAVVSVLAFFLCLAAMLGVLRNTLVRPIESLAAHVRDYAGSKNPAEADLIRSEKLTTDEVGSLALATADMIDQIRDYVIDVSRLSAERERVASELAVAHRIQLSALPPVETPFTGESGFSLFATMDPAKEVGGDFYDFFMVDEGHLALLIADVSGKGVPAALFMMRAKTLLRQLLSQGMPAAEAMSYANDGLVANNDEDMFVTVWLAVLDVETGKLEYSNGGHNPPLMHHASGEVEWLRNRSGLFLGSFAGVPYRGHELQMAAGDTLVLYTDGVTEAVDEAEAYYGDERLFELLSAQSDESPEGFVRVVRSDVALFAGKAPQADDITVLALRYEGKSQE